jgi:F-type H+-transporting ATPase subunit epsilon
MADHSSTLDIHGGESLPHKHGQVKCIVVTPEATLLDAMADFVALPLFDGEIGIAPKHSPMIGRLGYGEMRIVQGKQTQSLYVDGGFVQVIDDVVSVLTNRAIPAAELDPAVAEEHLQVARSRKANTPELLAQRERTELQARAQIRVARRAK